MILDIPKCPECGDPPRGAMDLTPGVALMSADEDGNYEYDGETEMFWDGQENVEKDPNKIRMICDGGHEWVSPFHRPPPLPRKPTFRVESTWQMTGVSFIEADSLEEAKRLVEVSGLPAEQEYLTDSQQITGGWDTGFGKEVTP